GLRLLLHTTTLQAARQAWTRLEDWVEAADTDETRRLWNTLNVWWSAIEVFITSRVTNARTEAANTAIKHIKRTGRGYRNNEHYQARILLRSARRTCGAAH
ncbi:Transposase, partial [Raineyella antarctica]